MNYKKLKDDGIASINKAVELDGHDFQEAFKFYVNGVGSLLCCIKYEKNHKSKNVLLGMVNGYITRAEVIKESLKKQKETTVNQKREIPSSVADDDDEKNQLRNNIKSTMINADDIGVKWSDVAGLENAKATIQEAVILPIRFPNLYTGNRKPWKGILLYGPPGTGKSFLAKAVATESKSTFFSVSSSDLISKWQGESEKAVKMLFAVARENAPSVIFIDEVDSLTGDRSDNEQDSMKRVKNEFLIQMQGMNDSEKRILVLGATNTPWTLDPAFRRRFEKRIYIPLPDLVARTEMFKNFMKGTEHNLTDNQFKELGKMTENYSGSDISVVLRDALMAPVRKCQTAKQFKVNDDGTLSPISHYPSCPKCPINLSKNSSCGKQCSTCGAKCITLNMVDPDLLQVPVVTFEDVVNGIEKNNSSVSNHELGRYHQWTTEFGQDGR